MARGRAMAAEITVSKVAYSGGATLLAHVWRTSLSACTCMHHCARSNRKNYLDSAPHRGLHYTRYIRAPTSRPTTSFCRRYVVRYLSFKIPASKSAGRRSRNSGFPAALWLCASRSTLPRSVSGTTSCGLSRCRTSSPCSSNWKGILSPRAK